MQKQIVGTTFFFSYLPSVYERHEYIYIFNQSFSFKNITFLTPSRYRRKKRLSLVVTFPNRKTACSDTDVRARAGRGEVGGGGGSGSSRTELSAAGAGKEKIKCRNMLRQQRRTLGKMWWWALVSGAGGGGRCCCLVRPRRTAPCRTAPYPTQTACNFRQELNVAYAT